MEEIAISWLKAVQALEKVANLGSKELLVIYAITAKDGELAGERLSAFFDKEFRNYDSTMLAVLRLLIFLKNFKEK